MINSHNLMAEKFEQMSLENVIDDLREHYFEWKQQQKDKKKKENTSNYSGWKNNKKGGGKGHHKGGKGGGKGTYKSYSTNGTKIHGKGGRKGAHSHAGGKKPWSNTKKYEQRHCENCYSKYKNEKNHYEKSKYKYWTHDTDYCRNSNSQYNNSHVTFHGQIPDSNMNMNYQNDYQPYQMHNQFQRPVQQYTAPRQITGPPVMNTNVTHDYKYGHVFR